MLNRHLQEQLAAAGRRWQQQSALKLGLRALAYVSGALVLGFVLDVVWHLDAGPRVALDGLLLAATVAVACAVFYVAQLRRTRPEQVARLLESRDPSLGSRLINALQLGQQAGQPGQSEATRALSERALAGYAADLGQRDLRPLAKSPTLRRELRAALLGMGAIALLLAVLYPISRLEFLRFLDPFGDHPPYSFTQIEITEPAEGTQVDYNGHILIKARTTGHRPDDLFLSFADPAQPSAAHQVPMYNKGELGFYQAIDGIKSDLRVTAQTKSGRSVSTTRHLKVVLTPKIERAFVEVQPPPYTGLAAREEPFDFKKLTALVGSQIKFRLLSNRPLASGAVTLPDGSSVALKTSAENEVSGALTASDSARLQFSVLDTAGHASQENPAAPLTVTHDLPPEIAIDTPAQDGFVCDDFVVEARLSATDDYGLKTIRIHRALNEVYSAPKVISYKLGTRTAAEAVTFDIKSLGVQSGDTISLFAEAVDTCPEPHLARSRTLHLMVISTEEYNNFLRERTDISDLEGKYAALLNEFHDRVDEQKALAEKAQALEEKMKDPEAAKEAAAQLDKLMSEQAELNKKLGALAERMEHFVREKPLYDLESELQKALAEKAAQMKESVAKNDEALQKALQQAAQAPNPQQLHDALASLEAEAKRQADELQPEQEQATAQTMPPLKDAALMNALVNDFNAVKYLHETQSTVASEAKAYETATPREEDKLALRQLASTEKAIEWALSKLVENLREHADAAEKVFPKAAAGARDLAEAVEEQKLSPLAGRSANTMLTGDGPESSALAERLHQELAALFAESQPGNSACKSEFDQYLKLQRGLHAGNSFEQMSKSRKFGLGQGQSQGSGQGTGGGLDGYATSDGGSFGVFGNETLGGDPKASGHGQSSGPPSAVAGSKVGVDATTSVAGADAVNRASRDPHSEAPMDEYRGVVEAYFNSITK